MWFQRCVNTRRSMVPHRCGTDVHYGQLAIASAGLLMLEATAVEAIGRITHSCLGLYSDENEAAIERVLQSIRGINPLNRVPVCIQLGHAGRNEVEGVKS